MEPVEKLVSNRLKLSLYIGLVIPSIFVSLLIFGHLIYHPNVMRLRQNHGLILMLIVNFVKLTTSIPLTMDFYRREAIFSRTHTTCTWINFYEFTIGAIILFLIVTVSLQRHLFIFNSQLMSHRRTRLLLHELPLLVCCLYPPIFYLIIILLDSCNYVDAPWDYTRVMCGNAVCYLVFDRALTVFEVVGNNGLPMLMIAVINMVLIVRVIQQKRRQHVVAYWRKHRRMILQMVSISMLHFLAWAPFVSVTVIRTLWLPNFVTKLYEEVLGDLLSLDCLLVPYFYLSLVPTITKKPSWIRWTRHQHTSTAIAAL
jgi:hypothetical protein